MDKAKLAACCVARSADVIKIWESFNRSLLQVALVTDDGGKLCGIITDGDIRRALVRGKPLTSTAAEIMNPHPLVFKQGETKDYMIRQMQKRSVYQAPIVDADGCIADVCSLKNLLLKENRSNAVVLMAGGLGTRLRPLTAQTPKPLLKVGNKPILETILTGFIENGFHRFFFAVNYKSEQIEAYFGHGDKWDVEINYLHEPKRLGTAGALSLLPSPPQEEIIVMNGDLLTKVDFADFLDYHRREKASATMGVREYSWQIPYGVVDMAGDRIAGITEKPVQSCYVNAGMYVLSPETVAKVQADSYLDMPDLFQELIAADAKTTIYPIRDYWMDIGRLDDFEQAQNDYLSVFGSA